MRPHSKAMSGYVTNSRQSDPQRVAIYARYSSDLQRPSSIEDQVRECKEAASRKGWTVLDQFVRFDEAATGQLAGREGLDELIKLAQQLPHPFDGIVIDDTSRFGRDLSSTLPMSDGLKYAKVFLYFVNRQLDSRDPNFRTLFIQYGQQDEQASLVSGEKVHRGQRGRVLKGYMGSSRAFGYTNVAIESTTRKGLYGRPAVEAVELRINPEEAPVVVRIFEMYASGLGYRAIAKTLNDERVPSPLQLQSSIKRLWNADSVKRTTMNEKYKGVNVWNQTQVVRNPMTQRKEQHPRPESEWERVDVPQWRIVPEELWNAVVAENGNRQGPSWWKEGGLNRSEASRRYIFSGLMSCADCGGNMNIVGGDKGSPRYGCIGHRYRGNCGNKLTILHRTLEAQMLEAITANILDPEVRGQLYRDFEGQQRTVWNQRIATRHQVASTIEELKDKRNDLKRQADNLLNAIQDSGRNLLFSERLNLLDVEIRNINELLATQTEVNFELLSPDAIREIVNRKLSELEALLAGSRDVAKQRIRKYISRLSMTPVYEPEAAAYQVAGDIQLFASDDPEGVLLAGSFQRSCKQYTSLSIPFQTILNARTAKGRHRSSSDGRYVKAH